MPPIPIPPPYGGQNDQIPLVALQPPFAESVVNFNLDDGNVKLRKGDSVYGTPAGGVAFSLVEYGSTLLAVYRDVVTNRFTGWNVTANTTYDPIGAGVSLDSELHTIYFNKYVTFFGDDTWTPGSGGNPTYNGSWALSGWTFPASSVPFGGGVYKNRAYILLKNTTKYVYTGINAISGATTEVDLAQVISREGKLFAIRSVSLSDGIQSDTLQCFIFDTGEVIAYSGSYPDSATWQLARRFFIPQPIGYNTIIEANGDVFVITWNGLISLRTLLTQGENVAIDAGITAPIKNRWEQAVRATPAAERIFIRGAFDRVKQRLVINFPRFVPRSGVVPATSYDSMRLVYAFNSGAWFEHMPKVGTDLSGISTDVAFFNGAIHSFKQESNVYAVVTKMEGSTDYLDYSRESGSVAYSYELISAPVSNGRAFVQMCGGLDVIMKSDLYSQTNFSLISDLGVKTSEVQRIPDQGTSLQKPFVNVGIEGSYIQYKVSGTTTTGKSVGLELYGFNFYQDNGTSPR